MSLSKAYDPKTCEDRIYKMWEESGAFEADVKSVREPFVISMPPPNATGELHLGHACFLTIEDVFIRFNRMCGKEALWLPGTDHASIATESVVIRKIQQEEGIADPRATFGRTELVRRIAEYVEKSRGTIRGQIRKMGSSCDWSRERFTLDPILSRCVNEVFVKMYRDGLIYRGHRIVNWDPKLQTTVSDDEIVYVEEKAPFYTFQYGPFQISTSRPETKFGDKYVVMHPDDPRYAQYKTGDTFTAEWINGPVVATVIKDKVIDPNFGTGVMTITPWHDHIDFDLAERHDLTKEQIIGFDGKLLPIAGEFAELPIEKARPEVVEKLKQKGLLIKVDEQYVHRVAKNHRGTGVIEPQIKEQWFIDVNKAVVPWERRMLSLKEIMQETVRTKSIVIIPERFEKTYFHWIDNLRDWCISRQIWWGHRVPVWYKQGAGAMDMHVGLQPPEGEGFEQDPDTLDTWFSSALWTWSTLIDPSLVDDFSLSLEDLLKKSGDFQKFHPTQVMETGYDILFFWVARMILMTTYATGDIPFETVYLHGLIRTRDGKKMSKSDPSTMIDPLDIIPKYGADALRLSMIVGQSPGADSRLYEEKIAGYRNFINKLWNASRFVLMQCEQAKVEPSGIDGFEAKTLADRALLHELHCVVADVTQSLQNYRLSEAGDRLYSFVWDFFCDWYLELSKGEANIPLLVSAVRTILQLAHPYCPFVTEELWSSFRKEGDGMLIRHPWPTAVASDAQGQAAAGNFQIIVDVITAIRKLRSDQSVEPGKQVDVTIVTSKHKDLLASEQEHIKRISRVGTLHIAIKSGNIQNVASAFLTDLEVHLSLEGLIDIEKERAGLEKERSQLQGYLAASQAKLQDDTFISRAPERVVQAEREKMKEIEQKLSKIEERFKSLS